MFLCNVCIQNPRRSLFLISTARYDSRFVSNKQCFCRDYLTRFRLVQKRGLGKCVVTLQAAEPPCSVNNGLVKLNGTRRERLKSALYLRLKRRKVFKIVKGGPFTLFQIKFVAKYQKKLKGGPFGDKKIRKKVAQCRKNSKGDPVVPFVKN